MDNGDGRIIGIDLGTTFSAMAYLDPHGTPVTIRNAEGELTTPSVVLFEEDGSVVVGREARRACVTCPERVAVCVKRDMGERYFGAPIAGRRLSPPSIAALILKKLKQDAEAAIGRVGGAVVTVPAHFDETRRQATVDAGALADLKVVDIIDEPTSAALAYAFRSFLDRGGHVDDLAAMSESAAPRTALIYDLGGGTFDVTILRVEPDILRVLATDGDVSLGGRDWDVRIVELAAEQFIQAHGDDPREDPQSYQDLLLAAEEAKKDLSARRLVRFAVNHAGNRLSVQLSREQFEEITSDLLFRTQSRLDRVLLQAELDWPDIDELLLVGGSTRMPQVVEMLRGKAGREPNGTLSADEVVAHGAAIHAAIRQVLGDRPGRPLEGGGEEDESLAGFEEADPDAAGPLVLEDRGQAEPVEAVLAAGATPAGAAGASLPFDPQVRDVLSTVTTVNVNAHSLGVVARDPADGREHNSILIPQNTPLPASAKGHYGTEEDDQRIVRIRIVEGESDNPDVCIPIGECVVKPLPPGLPKGSRIEVTFHYDSSGRLHVSARHKASGVTARSTIVRPGGMSRSDLQRAKQILRQLAVT